MKKPHAQWLTLHKADIDQDTSIEILWETASNTLNLLLFRISHRGTRPRLTAEEIGPYRSLAELRHQLRILFGKPSARRICHPCPWLPPGIPVAPASSSSTVTIGIAPDDRSAIVRCRLPQHERGCIAPHVNTNNPGARSSPPPTSHLAID